MNKYDYLITSVFSDDPFSKREDHFTTYSSLVGWGWRYVKKDNNTFLVSLPGVKKENISISYSNEEIIINIKEKSEFVKEGEIFKIIEVSEKLYNIDEIKTEFIDGVLSVNIPEKQKKKIDIAIS